MNKYPMSSIISFASMALLYQLFTPGSAFAQDPWGYTYGTAVADTACAMIDDGLKKKRVNRVLDQLESKLIAQGVSVKDSQHMSEGFYARAFRIDCVLQDRNK
tara:strand:+ start:215 stop:523 length:309 start_codon:yes stop_codon:yes gene_type:complete